MMGKSVTNVCLLLTISGLNGSSKDISVSHWQEPLPGTGRGGAPLGWIQGGSYEEAGVTFELGFDGC